MPPALEALESAENDQICPSRSASDVIRISRLAALEAGQSSSYDAISSQWKHGHHTPLFEAIFSTHDLMKLADTKKRLNRHAVSVADPDRPYPGLSSHVPAHTVRGWVQLGPARLCPLGGRESSGMAGRAGLE